MHHILMCPRFCTCDGLPCLPQFRFHQISSLLLVVFVLPVVGLRPYVCDICGSDFAEKKSLTKHSMTHSGKPFIRQNYVPTKKTLKKRSFATRVWRCRAIGWTAVRSFTPCRLTRGMTHLFLSLLQVCSNFFIDYVRFSGACLCDRVAWKLFRRSRWLVCVWFG